MTKGISALQSPEIGAPLRDFKHVQKTSRIFSRDLLSQKVRKKIEVSEPWKPIEYSKLLFILVKTLSLQRPLKCFLGVKYICSMYVRGAPDSGVYNALARVVIRHHNCFFYGRKNKNCQNLEVQILENR